jgi:hypothetical protein
MTIISTYSSGYTLIVGGYLSITSTGTIGGTGLAALAGSTAVNQGLIDAAAAPGGAGQAGGAAAQLSGAGVTLTNSGGIVGGAGGYGAAGSGSFFEVGYPGGTGGAGGAGVSLASGAVTNEKSITGGAGGVGGVGATAGEQDGAGGVGGAGGSGVDLTSGSVTNNALIAGGAGGLGGHGGSGGLDGGYGGEGGRGGEGATLSGGQVINNGTILGGEGGGGGLGGAGGFGSAPSGVAGAMGDGADFEGGGSIVNRKLIVGYNGVTATGPGGATLTNFATISGTHDAVLFSSASDSLIAESGALFDGEIIGGGGGLTLAGGVGTITGLGASANMTGSITGGFSGFGSYDLGAAAVWTLRSAESLSSSQSLTISAGADLRLSAATLTSGGEIEVRGGAMAAVLTVNGANTLLGAGTVNLNASGDIAASVSGGSLINLAEDIAGGGVIKGKLSLVNDSGGTIDANVGRMTLETSDTVTNDGLIEATGTGLLLVSDATINGSGGGTVTVGKEMELNDGAIEGGALTVTSGAKLLSSTDGGTVSLGAGTVSNAGTLEGYAGGLTIDGAVANTGTLLSDKGDLTVTGAVSGPGSARLVGSGVLEIDGALSENVAFAAGATGALILGDSAAFQGTVSGLSKTGTNAIDLKDLTYNAADTVSYSGTAAGGTLTIANGGTVIATIKLAGDYGRSGFKLADGGADGTIVTDPPTVSGLVSAMAGFAPGGAPSARPAAYETAPLRLLARPG